MESVRTVYVPVVVYIPVSETESSKATKSDQSVVISNCASNDTTQLYIDKTVGGINSDKASNILKQINNIQAINNNSNKHKSPKPFSKKIIGNLKYHHQYTYRENIRKSVEPYSCSSNHNLNKTIRIFQNQNIEVISGSTTAPTVNGIAKQKPIFKSNYYPSDFISNPCDQLFGPQPIDIETKLNDTVEQTNEALDSSYNDKDHNSSQSFNNSLNNSKSNEIFEYIPTPRWTKTQNSLLEELYRKGRFPKSNEIKNIAKQLHVMDSDVEEWFRKRRGRDRKQRRKNDNLRSLIDNYLHH